MSDSSPRLGLPDLPDTPELYADTVADAFARIDAFTDLYLKDRFVNAPPSSPADGDCYLTGGSPTGAWSGYAYKIATCRDGGWTMLAPFNGLRAFVESTNALVVYQDGTWLDWTSLLGAGESSIAAAATCDIGGAGSLFVAVTGSTTITSLGTAANRVRFLRFAGALTLTHNATSLVLPCGANLVTAAGDTAIFASDGSGNWRCRSYNRASGQPVAAALSVTSLAAASVDTASLARGGVGCAAIGTDGSLLVGTVATGGWSGSAKIEAVTSVAGAASLSGWASTGGTGARALLLRVDATTDPLATFHFGGATQVGAITSNGSVTTYATTSDARLKTVPAVQGDYRAAIRALWVGDFTWTDSGAPGFGVLAQQAWEVMPHRQGVTRPETEAGVWQASAEPFAHLALWGVKDLYAMIEALAARVAVLEAAHDAG